MHTAPSTQKRGSHKKQAPSLVLKPGTLLAGRYEVVEFIGRGASGSVYACKDRMLAELLVALKLWHPQQDGATYTGSVSLLKEILNCRKIDHPNVAAFYDCVSAEEFYGYSMEYVQGPTLHDVMQKQGRFELEKAVRLLKQIMRGLSAIHRGGLVHRDLKPSNVLINMKGEAKISDFGIAVEQLMETDFGADEIEKLHSVSQQKAGMSSVVGTPAYISPEYLSKNLLDNRSDLYAAGVIAYEIITGTTPYKSATPAQLFVKKVEEDPIPPSVLVPLCPPDLNAIVMNLLARDPEERYADARDVERDLARIKFNRKIRSAPVKGLPLPDQPLFVSRGPKLNISEANVRPGKYYRRRVSEDRLKMDRFMGTITGTIKSIPRRLSDFVKALISPFSMFEVELRSLIPVIALAVVIFFIVASAFFTRGELGSLPAQPQPPVSAEAQADRAAQAAKQQAEAAEILAEPGTPRFIGPLPTNSKSTVIRSMEDARKQSHIEPITEPVLPE